MPVARDRPAVPDGHRDSLPFDAPNYFDLRTTGLEAQRSSCSLSFAWLGQDAAVETGKIVSLLFELTADRMLGVSLFFLPVF